MNMKTLEEKMLVYRDNPGKETLADLLAYTDDHLITCTKALVNKYFFVACEEEEEIYQCCVIALTKASSSLKDNSNVEMLKTRIFFYCRSECMSKFRKFYAEKCGCGCEFLENADFAQTEESVEQNLIYEDLQNKLEELVFLGLIESLDLDILYLVACYGTTYKDTGRILNVPADKVSSRYKKTVGLLPKILNREDFV